MTTTTQKRRLRAHFGFSRIPFAKGTWAAHRFDSQGQRELLHGLLMWLELCGIALVCGQSGVGKSIVVRSFVQSLDESRTRVFSFSYLPSTVTGFLRSLNRKLGLPMRLHATDLFDAAQKHLVNYEQEHGPHPIVLLDDAEGLTAPVLDVLRRLTCYDLDARDSFSLLLVGTEDIFASLRHPELDPLRSRIVYAHTLWPFSLEDTRNYVRYHLTRADAREHLFTDEAIRRLFQASQGRPRSINQLATQTLISAAVRGLDAIDGKFVDREIAAHPLYQNPQGV